MKPSFASSSSSSPRGWPRSSIARGTRDGTQHGLFRSLSKEHAEIGAVASMFARYVKAEGDRAAAASMADEPELAQFAEEERQGAAARMESLERELQAALLPKDENDERNVFLEVRAGTGGDESALFAADLFRMYARYAERKRWKVELVSEIGRSCGYNDGCRASSARARTRRSIRVLRHVSSAFPDRCAGMIPTSRARSRSCPGRPIRIEIIR